MSYSISRRPNPWRLTTQILFTALFAAGPFITLGDSHLLHFDFTAGALHLFGMPLRPEGLLLALFAVLSATFVLLWLSASLGRLWCGWGCPQSVLSDFAEWTHRKAGKGNRVGAHLAMLALSGLLAAVTLLYFVYPARFFSLAFFSKPTVANTSFTFLWLLLYLDMALLKRTFCRLICPYGKFLTIVSDERALTVEMIPALSSKCIECGACARICPMELDVRQGAGGDCLRCGRCIDACATVMAPRQTPPLIGFTSGSDGGSGVEGGVSATRMLFGPRRWPLIIAAGVSLAVFVLVAKNPVETLLQVRVNPASPTKTLEGEKVAVFFDASVTNGTGERREFTLQASGPEEAEFRGTGTPFTVSPDQRERFRIVLVVPEKVAKGRISLSFDLLDGSGRFLASTALKLPPMAPMVPKETGGAK